MRKIWSWWMDRWTGQDRHAKRKKQINNNNRMRRNYLDLNWLKLSQVDVSMRLRIILWIDWWDKKGADLFFCELWVFGKLFDFCFVILMNLNMTARRQGSVGLTEVYMIFSIPYMWMKYRTDYITNHTWDLKKRPPCRTNQLNI